MSDNIIKDGTGKCYSAKVDIKNRLHVSADSKSALNSAIQEGTYFGVNTGFITLTSDNASAILYIKNDSATPFFLKTFRLACGTSISGTGVVKLELPLNPVAGTLITNAVSAPVFNLNTSSNDTFTGNAFVGAEGNTATGGAGNSLIMPEAGEIYDKDAEVIIPKGFSAAVIVTPPSGNISMEVQLLVTGYYIDEAQN